MKRPVLKLRFQQITNMCIIANTFPIPMEVSVKTPIKGVMAQRAHKFFHFSIPANFVKGKGKYTNLFIFGLQKKDTFI